jgi:pimeloyl-ACP methyl ester carboxylesterase
MRKSLLQLLPVPAEARVRRSSSRRGNLLALISLGAVLTSCVANRAYRDRDSRPWIHEPSTDNFVSGPQLDQYEPFDGAGERHRYDFSYIEFDEKGDFWDRRQLGWTVQEIKRAAQTNDLVLVVYIHGWQNDASTLRGHDVPKIHCLLKHLADADRGKHRFFGVYLGWRGKSVPGGDGVFPDNSIPNRVSKAIFFVPHELSLYSRKDAATRIAGMPVTEAIFQSVAAARNGTTRYGHGARTILVGHSLGALVLEKAMAQALAAKVISEGETFSAPADLVVLLNSAAESIYAKEMIDMFRRRYSAPSKNLNTNQVSADHPLLVSITSEADSATGMLFPIGTSLSNTFGLFRKYEWDTKFGESSHNVSQRDYFTHTPGHNDLLISHDAKPISGVATKPMYQETDQCNDEMLNALQRNLTEPLTGAQGEIQFVTIGQGRGETKWQLTPRIPNPRLNTPYWIVSVPKEIVRDHSDIFNENALAMMARIFRMSNPDLAKPGITTTVAPRTMRLVDPGEKMPPPPSR